MIQLLVRENLCLKGFDTNRQYGAVKLKNAEEWEYSNASWGPEMFLVLFSIISCCLENGDSRTTTR